MVLLDIGFLVNRLFLSALWTCRSPASWSPRLPVINQLSISCTWWFSSLLLLLRFFVFQQFEYDVSRCGLLWIYPTWSSLSFCDVQIVFHKIWEVWGHYFLKYSFYSLLFFHSFWDTCHIFVGVLDGFSYCIFQLQNFYLVFFYNFCFFIDILFDETSFLYIL